METPEFLNFFEKFKEYGCTSDMLDKTHRFYTSLIEWNRRVNLTRLTEWNEFIDLQVMDSISPLKFNLIKSGDYICDIGTGGGFPGIPLKIFCKTINVVLVESKKKKVNALREILKDIGLSGISAVWARAEEFCQEIEYRHKFDIVTVRAVGNDDIMKRAGTDLLTDAGRMILYKTETQIEKALKNDAKERLLFEYTIPGLEKNRFLEIIERVPRGT